MNLILSSSSHLQLEAFGLFLSMELKGENEDEMNQKKNNKNQEQGTIMGLFGPKKRVLPPAVRERTQDK